MTKSVLDEIEAALEVATKGKWSYRTNAEGDENDPAFVTDTPPYELAAAPFPIICSGAFWSHADGDLIVLAVNNARALVRVARAAEWLVEYPCAYAGTSVATCEAAPRPSGFLCGPCWLRSALSALRGGE